MTDAGFRNVVAEPVEHIDRTLVGEAVLGDPFLERSRTSQLLLISENDYARGKRAVHSARQGTKSRDGIRHQSKSVWHYW